MSLSWIASEDCCTTCRSDTCIASFLLRSAASCRRSASAGAGSMTTAIRRSPTRPRCARLGRMAGRRVARAESAERRLRAIREVAGPDRERPTLFFLHLALPHSPWRFLPSGREYGTVITDDGLHEDWSRWRSEPGLVDQAVQGHLLQVGYVDRLLGELLDRMEASGMYQRALVVAAADHGMSFQPGLPPRDPTTETLADIAAVPLFVKYPGEQTGRVDPRSARTTDILPTIADVIGVTMPWKVDGVPLRGASSKAPGDGRKFRRRDGHGVSGRRRSWRPRYCAA